EIGLRNAAVEALVGIGPDAVPGAVDALSRLDADGRKLAIEVLGGAPTLAGMRALARSLDDVDPNVVVAAAEGLGKAHLGGEEDLLDVAAKTLRASPRAHERVRTIAKEADDSIARGAAILALGLVRDPDDVSIIADALADDSVADRAEAALHLFGQEAVEP